MPMPKAANEAAPGCVTYDGGELPRKRACEGCDCAIGAGDEDVVGGPNKLASSSICEGAAPVPLAGAESSRSMRDRSF